VVQYKRKVKPRPLKGRKDALANGGKKGVFLTKAGQEWETKRSMTVWEEVQDQGGGAPLNIYSVGLSSIQRESKLHPVIESLNAGRGGKNKSRIVKKPEAFVSLGRRGGKGKDRSVAEKERKS